MDSPRVFLSPFLSSKRATGKKYRVTSRPSLFMKRNILHTRFRIFARRNLSLGSLDVETLIEMDAVFLDTHSVAAQTAHMSKNVF